MRITARIEDKEIQRALERGAGAEGSRSAAVREAIKQAYADAADDDQIGETQREALQALRVAAGPSGWIEVEAARSTVANRLNVPKSAVRDVVFEPLRRSDKITVARGMATVRLQITEPDK